MVINVSPATGATDGFKRVALYTSMKVKVPNQRSIVVVSAVGQLRSTISVLSGSSHRGLVAQPVNHYCESSERKNGTVRRSARSGCRKSPWPMYSFVSWGGV